MTIVNLGLDFGNVISKEKPIRMSCDFDWMNREYVEGCPQNLINIVPCFDEVYIVSKCSVESEVLIPKWLESVNFYGLTGIKPQNIRFCRERADKAAICKELKIGCFIDDRVEVLSHMNSVRYKIALNPKDNNGNFGSATNFRIDETPELLLAETWDDVYALLVCLFPKRMLDCKEGG